MNNYKYTRKKYWNQPQMGWYERAYIFEVVLGLIVTGKVFLGNLFKFMTFRKGAITTYYPEETRADYAANNRGKHILVTRANGKPQCVACNMCATVCPSRVIEITAGFDPDDYAHPKFPLTFAIDYSRCVFCGLCVEACPEDAIRMLAEVPNLPSYNRHDMWLTKEELLTWHPQNNPAKVYKDLGAVDKPDNHNH